MYVHKLFKLFFFPNDIRFCCVYLPLISSCSWFSVLNYFPESSHYVKFHYSLEFFSVHDYARYLLQHSMWYLSFCLLFYDCSALLRKRKKNTQKLSFDFVICLPYGDDIISVHLALLAHLPRGTYFKIDD